MSGSRLVVLGLLGPLLAFGSAVAAGFASVDHGARTLGMGGAFGAQADPAAMFWNPGGLAFLDERSFLLGITMETIGESSFGGPDAGRQSRHVEPLPQFYWVEPLRSRWVFGLAANSPFRLDTEWDDPDDWAGRFIAEKATLRVLDLNPNLAFKAGERFGLALGVVLRASEVRLRRREALFNPNTQLEQEAARLALESDIESSIGWNFGLLHRASRRFSWGLSYRSAVQADHRGTGRLTQVASGDAVFDALAGATLPFGQDLSFTTSIDFPDWLNLAAAYQITPTVLVEVDVNRTGWSVLDTTRIVFDGAPLPDTILLSDWDDSNTYRAGVSWTGQGNSEWRVGVYVDETPQPDHDVSPLLADADRIVCSIGYGTTVGNVGADFALAYIDFAQRNTATNRDGFNGSYQNRGWILATSFAW